MNSWKNKFAEFQWLEMEYYHKNNFKFSLEKISATSASIQTHIQRAFLQNHFLYNSCLREISFLDPLDDGFVLLHETWCSRGFSFAIVIPGIWWGECMSLQKTKKSLLWFLQVMQMRLFPKYRKPWLKEIKNVIFM